eukprot:c33013_g1_i1 orf=131-454(-)
MLHHSTTICTMKALYVIMVILLLVRIGQCYEEDAETSSRSTNQEGALTSSQNVVHVASPHWLRKTYRRQLLQVKRLLKEEKAAETMREETVFHVDYSGPKTHPPKNN